MKSRNKSTAWKGLKKNGSQDSLRLASVWILFLGVASFAIWFVTNDDSMMSMLLALAAISTITLAILLYFLSPARSVRSDVCDAMTLSGTLEIRKILSSLYIESKGIYVPAAIAGSTKVFVPLSGSIDDGILTTTNFNTSENVFFLPENDAKGVLLSPPGNGLFQYARRIGANFTSADIENEIVDVIENSLELADKVSVKADGERVNVTLNNIVNHELCYSIRKEDPSICAQTGCPVCSAVSCMVANGTGKMASVESIRVNGKTVNIEYRLIGE